MDSGKAASRGAHKIDWVRLLMPQRKLQAGVGGVDRRSRSTCAGLPMQGKLPASGQRSGASGSPDWCTVDVRLPEWLMVLLLESITDMMPAIKARVPRGSPLGEPLPSMGPVIAGGSASLGTLY